MPRGGTWGYRGGLGVKFIYFFEIQPDLVSYSHEWHIFWGPRPLGPWGGVKN